MTTDTGIRYAVEYPRGAYCSDVPKELFEWCTEQFGPDNILTGRWFALEYTVQFKHRRDRDWYLLRWS